MDSNAKARGKVAKEGKAKESAISVDRPGTFRESAPNSARAKDKANESKENAPTNDPRAREMRKEPGAGEDTKEHGAKEDFKGRGKGIWRADGDEAQ